MSCCLSAENIFVLFHVVVLVFDLVLVTFHSRTMTVGNNVRTSLLSVRSWKGSSLPATHTVLAGVL